MIKKYKFDYDYKNDDLFIYDSNRKSSGSVELDNLILDFGSDKEICGMEFVGASTMLNDLFSEKRVSKKLLKELSECKVDIVKKDSVYIIKLMLKFNTDEVFAAPVMIPMVERQSPSIA